MKTEEEEEELLEEEEEPEEELEEEPQEDEEYDFKYSDDEGNEVTEKLTAKALGELLYEARKGKGIVEEVMSKAQPVLDMYQNDAFMKQFNYYRSLGTHTDAQIAAFMADQMNKKPVEQEEVMPEGLEWQDQVKWMSQHEVKKAIKPLADENEQLKREILSQRNTMELKRIADNNDKMLDKALAKSGRTVEDLSGEEIAMIQESFKAIHRGQDPRIFVLDVKQANNLINDAFRGKNMKKSEKVNDRNLRTPNQVPGNAGQFKIIKSQKAAVTRKPVGEVSETERARRAKDLFG